MSILHNFKGFVEGLNMQGRLNGLESVCNVLLGH